MARVGYGLAGDRRDPRLVSPAFAVVRVSLYLPAGLRGVLRFGVVPLRPVSLYMGHTCWYACRLTVCGVCVVCFASALCASAPARVCGRAYRVGRANLRRRGGCMRLCRPLVAGCGACPLPGGPGFQVLLITRSIPEGTERPRDSGYLAFSGTLYAVLLQ